MNNVLIVSDKCTGCTSCMNSCPKNAIVMTADVAGFCYPEINKELCVDCGKCIKVCPVMKEHDTDEDTRINAYYGSIDDIEVVKKSSSGGAFTLMANYVVSLGGVACGAAMNYDGIELVYNSTDSCGIDELRRSKYIASNPHDIFRYVKRELEKNRPVLFCGLPCHVDGLKSFLEKEFDNLITCDFICGGTASPEFFREHLKSLEKKYRSGVKSVNFRAKLYGWKEHSIKIEFENGKSYCNSAFYDSFFKGYFEKPYQRDSCYNCRYRLKHRSDVIIADYWGGLKKGRGNDNGVSMVITNSVKGDEFFSKALLQENNNFVTMPLEDSDYVFKSEAERYTKAFEKKKEFLEIYKKCGFEKAARRTYFKGVFKAKLKRKVLNIIKKH